jgi:outer membrane protein assembly factor BamB
MGGTGVLPSRVSVLQHHNHASRDGVYIDPLLTKAAAAGLHMDTTFAGATISGPTYAQPLYLAGTGTGPDLVIAVTEQNRVYAFNASTGAQLYNVLLGPPLPRSQLSSLGSFCGNIDPLGATGTPVIDESTRTLYLDAMTSLDGTAANARHQVYALNADTGATVQGWPVDLNAHVPAFAGTSFNSLIQNQRGALVLLGGKVFVPFGGHIGDCGSYHGWVVGISTSDPTKVSSWCTRAIAGGIWAPGGIASDGTSLFIATGNTEKNPNNFSPPDSWQDGEAVFRLSSSLAAVDQNSDYFAPTNWAAMDTADQDLGGANPLVIDVAGATPSKLIIALGKDGKAYVLDRTSLGGISAPVSMATVSTGSIITAPAVYTTPNGSYIVFKGAGSGCPTGQSGSLTAVKIGATSPPNLKVAWCAGPSTNASVAVSVSNAQGQDALVWVVGSDNKLHAMDGDTGSSVFGGGTSSDTVSTVQKFVPPIIANGRVFVASNNQVYAFAP